MSDIKSNFAPNVVLETPSQIWLRRTLGALVIAAGPTIGSLVGQHMGAEKSSHMTVTTSLM